MGKLFDQNNPFFRIMNVLFDLIVLNVLTLLCSIPIVTAGASFTAMHSVLWRMVRREENYISRQFFEAFKRNFKQATAFWLVVLALLAIGLGDVWILSGMDGPVRVLLEGALAITACLVLVVGQYYFVMLSRYENSVMGHVRNAAKLAFGFFPRTLGMLVIMVAFALAYLQYLGYVVPLILLLGVTLPQYCCAWLYDPIFRRLDNDVDADGKLVKSTFV
ncbi:YesL family protein [Bifidobacterium eulemuris]|uniref:YesL family protein n=1 Tax=Bifidobacterium eulemuris TaxID=1765219 RepID=A0A261GE49_9BIFI|nr:DUF624 domain-containing protein [Bifidobacterium eulemuris]OZG69687.1 hypothetical protein BEUL_0104 [Bifidobacterium eulemuris]QOL32208.1 YesL family protein [Bifidobacterium eulemuris]